MKTSLKDIAEELHLSKTTVSWVLSGQGDEKAISKKTQKRIIDYAKLMKYQPNLLARSLNTGISKTVGLIIPDITDSFYSHIALSVETNLATADYSLMIASSNSDVIRENQMINLFKARQVDGLIIAPTKKSKKEIQNLIDDKFPLVLFDRYFPDMNTDYVIINNDVASYELVHKMIMRGARKIAILTTNSYLRTMNMRYEGYARALEEAGIQPDPNLYGEISFVGYEEGVYKTLDTILSKVPDVDGFFFTTHILALVAFRYFFKHNIDFKSNYELACIHGIPELRIMAPKMLIARMPIEEMGKNIVRILAERIQQHINNNNQDEENTEKIVLSCSIIE
jgi:LacI family transcriptional regulator